MLKYTLYENSTYDNNIIVRFFKNLEDIYLYIENVTRYYKYLNESYKFIVVNFDYCENGMRKGYAYIHEFDNIVDIERKLYDLEVNNQEISNDTIYKVLNNI